MSVCENFIYTYRQLFQIRDIVGRDGRGTRWSLYFAELVLAGA